MPQNRRPSGLINSNPEYEGTTIAQRRNMQNIYDLLAEQEKANELASKKIEADRRNTEIIANAQIEAAQIAMQKEQDILENNRLMEISRQNHEEKMRCLKLCDDLGVNYDDIIAMANKMDMDRIAQNIEYIDSQIEIEKEIISQTENEINDIERDEQLLNKKIDKENITIPKCENDEDIAKAVNYINEIDKKIESFKEIIENNKNSIIDAKKNKNSLLKFGTVFSIIFSIILLIALGKIDLISILVVSGLGAFIILFFWLISISNNKHVNKLVEKFEEEIKKYENNIYDILQPKYAHAKSIINLCEQDIKSLINNKEEFEIKEKEKIIELGNNFIEFRISHYNEKMEELLMKLNIKPLKLFEMSFELTNNKTIEEVKTGNGTIKDYIQYFKKQLIS